MCTVRYIDRFLPDDRLEVPWAVIEHLAAQLGIADVSCVKRYTERKPTAYEHAWEIRDAYEYDDPEWSRRFRTFLHGRAWTHAEGPKALFDHAVGWLRVAADHVPTEALVAARRLPLALKSVAPLPARPARLPSQPGAVARGSAGVVARASRAGSGGLLT
ncbi:DUF4158 domain-containing protein [Streptomyces sp. NBC_01310]|nr:DUF4158 domain-containing protein [Streptomyces sp. NBC_01310]